MNTQTAGRLRPAGDAVVSSVPQGTQWLGVAFVVGMFGLFMWGVRKESPEEIEAYNRMKAARAARR
jgi:hypothetical protein